MNRQCSFNPEKFLRSSNGGKSFYIPITGRILWFQAYAAEHKLPCSIEVHLSSILTGTAYIQAEAIVKLGDEIYTDISGVALGSIRDNGYGIQTVSSLAKSRALSNAGFCLECEIDSEIIPTWDDNGSYIAAPNAEPTPAAPQMQQKTIAEQNFPQTVATQKPAQPSQANPVQFASVEVTPTPVEHTSIIPAPETAQVKEEVAAPAPAPEKPKEKKTKRNRKTTPAPETPATSPVEEVAKVSVEKAETAVYTEAELAEALNMSFPIKSHEFYGMTLGELNQKFPGSLSYYAVCGDTGLDEDFVHACKVIEANNK